MSEKIFVLGSTSLVLGFRLVGIEGEVVNSPKECEERLNEKLNDESIGIIVVEENLYNRLDWKLKKYLESIARPVVIPVSHKAEEGGESLDMLIKRALGFELKSSR